MDTIAIIELTNEHTRCVMAGYPLFCGSISIAGHLVIFNKAKIEFIDKALNSFDESFYECFGGRHAYRLIFDDPIIPLAPEIDFGDIKYTQIPISAQTKINS